MIHKSLTTAETLLGVVKYSLEEIPIEKPHKVFLHIEPINDDSKLNARVEIENDEIDTNHVEHDDPQLEVFFYYQPHSKADFSKQLEYENMSTNLVTDDYLNHTPEHAIITIPTEYL